MEIKQLYDKIQSGAKDNTFRLSAQTTGIEAFERVCAVFAAEYIFLREFACTLEQEKLRFSGRFELGTVKNLGMKVTVLADGKLETAFFLSDDTEMNVFAFMCAMLEPTGLDLGVLGIKSELFKVKSFSFSYTATTKGDFDDYFKFDIKTDIGFTFSGGKFGFTNVGFHMERYGEEYSVYLYGDLRVLGKTLLFTLGYGGGLFALSVSGLQGAALGRLEDMGALVGEGNIAAGFPEGFDPAGHLLLHRLQLTVSSDFKEILTFHIAVLLDNKWQLCSSPKMTLSGILASFHYTPQTKRFELSGDVEFAGIKTRLSGSLNTDQKQWFFAWRMHDQETISLTKFITDLSRYFNLSPTAIKLPEIEIGSVSFIYNAGRFSVQAYVYVTKSALFSSAMKIKMDSGIKDGKRDFHVVCSWQSLDGGLSVHHILKECGVTEGMDDIPEFLRKIAIHSVELEFSLLQNRIYAKVEVDNIGGIEFDIVYSGDKKSVRLEYRPQIAMLSLSDIPVAGGLTAKFLPPGEKEKFSVSDIRLIYRSAAEEGTKNPAGVSLLFKALGEMRSCQLYEKKPVKQLANHANQSADHANQPASPSKTFWIQINKTLAILTLHRIGVGLDGARLALVVDASLSVSPLTFQLNGAGIGVNLSDASDLGFYLSGFGVSFQNNTLSISGEFNRSGKSYTGKLLIQIKEISVFALAEYSPDGHLFAYAVLSGKLGGPPAFCVTGLALGFGYNKRIIQPPVEKVASFPLIRAAMGKLETGQMLSELKDHIVDEAGQRFLSFGVKFTTFEIAESFVLMTVDFGNRFEINVIGLSNITMPPNCGAEAKPIAKAQLALKAAFRPDEGFLGIEARLTSESYILSDKCRLTGGFAFYTWFGGAHQGDFVITLGGYHPRYALTKPAHYPNVPRVGFHWDMDKVNISGEMYFALTPSAMMAGGRLSMTYTAGKFKAYFVLKADFLICWKPFSYDASLRLTMGCSYHVDLWFVSFTLSIELGVGLHLWGPDFSGTAWVDLGIISISVSFGANAAKGGSSIDWSNFKETFLPQGKEKQEKQTSCEDNALPYKPLSLSFLKGLNGELTAKGKNYKSADANGVVIQVQTLIPLTDVQICEKTRVQNLDVGDILVVPMRQSCKGFSSELAVRVLDEKGNDSIYAEDCRVFDHSLPTALWSSQKAKKQGDVVILPSGIHLSSPQPEINLFPEKSFISLTQLYEAGKTTIHDAFRYRSAPGLTYECGSTIDTFKQTINQAGSARKKFLSSLGITLEQEINLSEYAAWADDYLDEEPWLVRA